jgi:hypothetical protein
MSQTLRARISLGDLSFHSASRQAFGGADVNEWLQGVLDDGLGEGARGVVGAVLRRSLPGAMCRESSLIKRS